LAQSPPSGFKVVRIHGSLPTRPTPSAPALDKGSGVHLFWPALSMTLETKLTMADAGWLGSSSAKRWQALSVVLPCFRATKPKSLRGEGQGDCMRTPGLEEQPGGKLVSGHPVYPALQSS
jgi:hypothetical protein